MFPNYSQAQPAEFTWQAQEVVRVVDHKPHLVVRILVAGGFFPHRALVPVMQIVQGEKIVAQSWFTEISDDNRSLLGYFATDLPEEGTLEFGYYDQPLGRVHVKFEAKSIKRLDRKRLDKEVVVTSMEYLKQKREY